MVKKSDQFVDFNDPNVPLGKRKQAYVRWAMSKGTSLDVAKKQANKKFGMVKKGSILVIVTDYGRRGQRSWPGFSELYYVWQGDRHENIQFIWSDDLHLERIQNDLKKKGWKIDYDSVHG